MARQRHRRTTTQAVARLLEADAEHLVEFVEHHPDPTPEAVAAAGITGIEPGELERDDRRRLAAWIEARKDQQREDARYWTLAYIQQHEPVERATVFNDITESTPAGRHAVSRAIHLLRKAGYITREDQATEPWLRTWVYRTADES